jgi:hypothetical protein
VTDTSTRGILIGIVPFTTLKTLEILKDPEMDGFGEAMSF